MINIIKKTSLISVLLYFSLINNCFAQHSIEIATINSYILNRQVNYQVILPPEYNELDTNFPVIYLLPGFGGDYTSWVVRCKMQLLADSLFNEQRIDNFIFVTLDAFNSYYINNYNGTLNYMDFFSVEFVPHIDSLYKTRANRENRTLMGLSMGGFGAIIMSLKHPELFGNAIAMSAAVRDETTFIDLPQDRYEIYFGKIFGPGLMPEQRITEHWKDNSPFTLIDSTLIDEIKTINWYIDCGLNDFLFQSNETFHQLLANWHINHEYHVRPGKHNWAYWYKSTINSLLFINEITE